MTSKKRLAKSTAIVSSGIMTSRILGFVRDVLIANFFGAGIAAESFFVAFTIPNALRQLVAEGAVNTVLVPVLTEHRAKESRAEFWHFANVFFNVFLFILLLIVIIGVLIAPFIARIIAPGFIGEPEKLSLTIKLIRLLLPYILLVGLTAYCAGILNTFNHFIAPAFATTVLNVTIITGMMLFYPNVNIMHLTGAILVGGILQLSIQIPPLLRRGPFFSPRSGLIHEKIRKVGRLLLPRMIGGGIYQINIVVDRMLASLHFIVGKGAIAALYYGNRLFNLPLALFGIAIATAALPTMSSLAGQKDIAKLKETISFSIRNMLFFSIPASIGLMVLSRPIIQVLFERGKFTPYITDITSSALFFYAIGLIAYGGVKILVAAFYSMQDTITPVKIASLALVSNIILNLILMVPLKVGGLALATSLSGFINFSALYVILRKKIGAFEEKQILKLFLKVLIASLVMGIIAYVMMTRMLWGGSARNILNLITIIISSLASYALMALLLRIRSLRTLRSWIKKS